MHYIIAYFIYWMKTLILCNLTCNRLICYHVTSKSFESHRCHPKTLGMRLDSFTHFTFLEAPVSAFYSKCIFFPKTNLFRIHITHHITLIYLFRKWNSIPLIQFSKDFSKDSSKDFSEAFKFQDSSEMVINE